MRKKSHKSKDRVLKHKLSVEVWQQRSWISLLILTITSCSSLLFSIHHSNAVDEGLALPIIIVYSNIIQICSLYLHF